MYDNVLNYIESKQEHYQELSAFIDYYHEMRQYFNYHSVKEGLNKFYQDSEYLSFLASLVNGAQRVANMELLLQKMVLICRQLWFQVMMIMLFLS